MLEHGSSGPRAYGQSKLAQIMSGFELAGRLPAAEVTVNSLRPATYMPTKMVLEEAGSSIDSLEDGVAATRRLVSDSASPPPAAASSIGPATPEPTRRPTTPRPAPSSGGEASVWLTTPGDQV